MEIEFYVVIAHSKPGESPAIWSHAFNAHAAAMAAMKFLTDGGFVASIITDSYQAPADLPDTR